MSASITKDQQSELRSWQLNTFEAPPRTLQPTNLPTAERVERVYQQATEQGYQTGYTEGYAKARDCGERLGAVLANLQGELSALDQTVAEDLLRLALTIAGQVLTTALEVKPELIIPLVREAVQSLAHSGAPATLTVNPADAVLVREALSEHLQHGGVKVLEDKTLARGGCRLHSAGSTIDAAVGTRWQRVVESIGSQLANEAAWLK
jgi:flagellar assembly protein FliH